MRCLASIQQVSKLESIFGTDKVEKATVLGWTVIVKKNEFKINDKCVFITIDSVVPKTNAIFNFLASRNFTVKTIKLKNCISQGLCLPLTYFVDLEKYKVGTDITTLLNINCIKNTNVYEKHIQDIPEIISEYKNKFVSCTEKLDGYNYIATLKKRKFSLPFCKKYSFNYKCLDDFGITIDNNIEKLLLNTIGENDSITLKGEICGPLIKGNKYYLKKPTLFIYDIEYKNKKVIKKLSQRNIKKFATKHNLRSVPFLGEFKLTKSIEDLVSLSKSENSKLNNHVKREGLIIREARNNYAFSAKIMNPDFLLKYDM